MGTALSAPASYKMKSRSLETEETTSSLTIAEIAAEIHHLQERALFAFYESTRMAETTAKHNWNFDDVSVVPICSFTGVECDIDGFVVALELVGIGLAGNLPDIFDQFFKLRRIQLFNNSLYGGIPPTLLESPTLNHLNVGHNFLTGPFPNLSQLPQLSRLIVDRNAFSGTLPSSICGLELLETIDLSSITKMHGPIPSCLGDLANLSKLRLTDTGFTGQIPPSLCGERDMNGFSPNTLGCDAIACPQGYYQKPVGRQTKEESPCRVCDVPSNVIGSSTCQWHERFDQVPPPTIGPMSDSPTPRPTSRPTILPSTEASTPTPTVQPSLRLFGEPSGAPSGTPTRQSITPPFNSSISSTDPHITTGPIFVAKPTSLSQFQTRSPVLSPSFHPSDLGARSLAPSLDSSLLSPSAGGAIAGSAAFIALLFVAALFMLRKRLRDPKLFPLEDDELLPPTLEKSNDPFEVVEEREETLVPVINLNASILRTSLHHEVSRPPPPLHHESRRVRFDIPDAKDPCESLLDDASLLSLQHEDSSPQPKKEEAWTHWMNPILDPIRLCQAPFQRYGSDAGVSLVSYDSSAVDESKSNAESMESRDELESVLGIRDRYSIRGDSQNGGTAAPVTQTSANELLTGGNAFTLDEAYHDIGDNELAAEHVADCLGEV